jgi:hypothetical protein
MGLEATDGFNTSEENSNKQKLTLVCTYYVIILLPFRQNEGREIIVLPLSSFSYAVMHCCLLFWRTAMNVSLADIFSVSIISLQLNYLIVIS